MMGTTERILVVDDEPQVRNALARTIRQLGHTPVVAASAEEAVALSQEDAFKVVISDLQMPGMGGLALLQRLSTLQPRARFVIVTGCPHVEPDAIPRGHNTRVFKKPWKDEELAAVILGDRDGRPSSIPPAQHTNRPPANVLLIEDDAGDAVLFDTALRLAHPGQFLTHHAKSLEDARRLLGEQHFDVIALDLDLGEQSGLQTITKVQAEAPDVGLVVLSGLDNADLALQSVQVGAQDYLVKGKVGGGTIGKALRYAEERKRAEQRLSEIAFHDQLTGLANRTLFRQRVAQALARARRAEGSFAVLLLDIDRFKAINDAFGHDAGDTFLQELSRRLESATRETDTVARLGGDEFAILAEPVETPADVEALAGRVLRYLRAPLQVAGVELTPTASIGAAIYPDSGQDSDGLLAAADAAMYVVKGDGRNGVRVHGAELTEQVAHRVQMEAELRHAIKAQELDLFYQPQVGTNGELVGAEALMRWRRQGRWVAAGEFVHVLEDTGLILELGPWVLRTAFRQFAAWRSQGLPIQRIAVNLSARQFARGDLPALIRQEARAAGVQPHEVELELTETALIKDSDNTAEALQSLAGDGFRLALDDFGTGYCSLAYLLRFPISVVKIDRSFVCDVSDVVYKRNLVGGIIQLARHLGLDVVAEGVETEGQLAVLLEEGCGLLQGYLFGKPQSAEDFARLSRQDLAG